MKISVICPSFLGEYPGCASNRKQSFIRAVNSFLSSSHKQKELIIASDGCVDTTNVTKKTWKHELELGIIVLLELQRHELFDGRVRQTAIDNATGDILVNLDTDDYFLNHHLTSIACSFSPSIDWAYFNYYIRPDNIKGVNHLFDCDGTLEKMNNGTIAWRRGLDVTWNGCDGRQDNKMFISQLLKFPKVKKIYGAGYCVTNIQIKNIITS